MRARTATAWTGICAVFSPPHIPICVVSATAPDRMEFVAKGLGRNIKHRGPIHIFTHWLILPSLYSGLGFPRNWGRRFRTGDSVEYAISAGVVIVCIALSHITVG